MSGLKLQLIHIIVFYMWCLMSEGATRASASPVCRLYTKGYLKLSSVSKWAMTQKLVIELGRPKVRAYPIANTQILEHGSAGAQSVKPGL